MLFLSSKNSNFGLMEKQIWIERGPPVLPNFDYFFLQLMFDKKQLEDLKMECNYCVHWQVFKTRDNLLQKEERGMKQFYESVDCEGHNLNAFLPKEIYYYSLLLLFTVEFSSRTKYQRAVGKWISEPIRIIVKQGKIKKGDENFSR